MRMWITALLTAMAMSMTAGCGPNSGTDKQDAAPPPPAPTVFDDQLRAIDKAKAVDTEMQNRVHDLDRQIESSEDGATPAGDAANSSGGSH
jgi:hypothetical protein